MSIEALTSTTLSQKGSVGAEKIDQNRNKLEKAPEELTSPEATSNSVQPEELLSQIKSLTEDGVYSVRFESDAANKLIVKVVDSETDEVIRQIPPEELMELTKHLNELRGNLVDTVS